MGRRTNRGTEFIHKTRRLKGVLAQLSKAAPGLVVRDWDIDRFAIGLVVPAAPSLVIAVSCLGKRPGHLRYSIERNGVPVEAADEVPAAELIAAVQRQLAAQPTKI